VEATGIEEEEVEEVEEEEEEEVEDWRISHCNGNTLRLCEVGTAIFNII
jgi:hypothetical protein